MQNYITQPQGKFVDLINSYGDRGRNLNECLRTGVNNFGSDFNRDFSKNVGSYFTSTDPCSKIPMGAQCTSDPKCENGWFKCKTKSNQNMETNSMGTTSGMGFGMGGLNKSKKIKGGKKNKATKRYKRGGKSKRKSSKKFKGGKSKK